ncbi:MAG TPA: hypothetical protein VFI06_09720 [Chitinophagaceae bacterium]|nr:hypothetical protein [Chitinophagaceae bacterium]
MRLSKLIILVILISAIYSCSDKAFPESKFVFSDKYASLIRPYKVGDTLLYKNDIGYIDTFVITRSGSTVVNTKGSLINQRAYKYISFSYNQLPTKQWTHEKIERDANNNATKVTIEDDELISLNIYPDNGEESCHISFKNFRGNITRKNDEMLDQPISTNSLTFNHYHKVENTALDLVKYPTDIKTIYVTEEKGIVAYQDQEGHWWTRVN